MGADLRVWAVVNGVYQLVLHLRVVKGVHRGGPRGAEGVLEGDQRHMDGWIEPVVRFEVLRRSNGRGEVSRKGSYSRAVGSHLALGRASPRPRRLSKLPTGSRL